LSDPPQLGEYVVVAAWEAEAAIMAARADERDKAAQRIEELGCSERCGCSITIPNAAAAARGEAS
jgi:hypothetical protein